MKSDETNIKPFGNRACTQNVPKNSSSHSQSYTHLMKHRGLGFARTFVPTFRGHRCSIVCRVIAGIGSFTTAGVTRNAVGAMQSRSMCYSASWSRRRMGLRRSLSVRGLFLPDYRRRPPLPTSEWKVSTLVRSCCSLNCLACIRCDGLTSLCCRACRRRRLCVASHDCLAPETTASQSGCRRLDNSPLDISQCVCVCVCV